MDVPHIGTVAGAPVKAAYCLPATTSLDEPAQSAEVSIGPGERAREFQDGKCKILHTSKFEILDTSSTKTELFIIIEVLSRK